MLKKNKNKAAEGTAGVAAEPVADQAARDTDEGAGAADDTSTVCDANTVSGSDMTEDGGATETERADGDAVAADAELAAKLAEAEKQSREYLERWQRSAAEFDNYRRRTQNEMDRLYAASAADIIAAFLPVVDSIERAIAASDGAGEHSAQEPQTAAEAGDAGPAAALREGIVLIERQVGDVFRKLKVEPLPGVGEQFDPNLHEAVMHVSDEAYGPNTITEVFVKGYSYKERVVRHSMVKVAN